MHERVIWISGGQPGDAVGKTMARASVSLCWAASIAEARVYGSRGIAAVVLDLPPDPPEKPESLLRALQREMPGARIMIRQCEGTIAEAVRMIKLGAEQYFGGDVDVAQVARQLVAAIEPARPGAADTPAQDGLWSCGLIGQSQALLKIKSSIAMLASRRCSILITGETGTGKEVVARALHAASERRHGNMLALNCAAIPHELLESELFGHTKGAFTGAVASRPGYFQQADGGTLLLDEVGDMSPGVQSKLLRVLQSREIQPLGSSEVRKVDVRVIAATNVDLRGLVRQGRFRDDLFYRLNVVQLHLPPLRNRIEDIPLLGRHFMGMTCQAEGLAAKELDFDAQARLCSYPWPGNIRELENSMEAAVIMSGTRRILGVDDFPWLSAEAADDHQPATGEQNVDFNHAVNRFERALLQQTLQKANGNKTLAARMLQMKRTTLISKLRMLERTAA